MISAISDTANWVAWYRALESARPEPLFRDPWSAELAGDRGRAIAASMRGLRDGAGIVAVRTALIDQMVTDAIARDRIDTVVNLACGFDTRAFRLELPARLRWFDIDGSANIQRKRAVLEGSSPRCSWQPLVADLAVETERRETLHIATKDAQRALVLTEGLLLYLRPDQVAELATELAAQPACIAWVTDVLSAAGKQRAAQIYKKRFADSGIAVQFGPEDSKAFFSKLGFAEMESRSVTQQAYELRRLPSLYKWLFTLAQLSPRALHTLVSSSRVVRLGRRAG